MRAKIGKNLITTPRGWLTAEIARKLTPNLERSGCTVYFDHGRRFENNVGKIVCWYGQKYEREARLSHLDIAITDQSAEKNTFALIEIEETTGRPKSLLADVFGTFMGEHFNFRGKDKSELRVGPWTTFIVIVRSSPEYEGRTSYLAEKIENFNSALSVLNTSIGEVFIGMFLEDSELEPILKKQIGLALERGVVDPRIWRVL